MALVISTLNGYWNEYGRIDLWRRDYNVGTVHIMSVKLPLSLLVLVQSALFSTVK